MNGLVFYIGLGLGLALAAGLRPFLPALLAGALASAGALGVSFAHGPTAFLQSRVVAARRVRRARARLRLQLAARLAPIVDPGDRRQRPAPFAAALAGLGLGTGALLFAGTLAAHGDSPWPGLVGGLLAAGLAQRACWPVVARRAGAPADRAAREALTVYLDAAALVLAALVALLHPLGYVALAAVRCGCGSRAGGAPGRKYAGLRILGR